jgi:hypothetical protein
MDTAERIANVINVLTRIENKLDAWKDTPQAVKELRADIDAFRREEQREREDWRDRLYRLLTSLAGLVKPPKNRPPTGDEADGKAPPPIS